MNPELVRNAWLELTPHRLVAMPVILGAVFYLTYLVNGSSLDEAVAGVAMWGVVLILVFWATRLASESVLEEVVGRTWDGQRMSSLSPWTMTWGKLIGATVYPWYGAMLCAIVYVAADRANAPLVDSLRDLVLVAAGAIISHSVGLMASLHAIGKREITGTRSIGYSLAGLIVGVPFILAGLSASDLSVRDELVRWYGTGWPARDLVLASALAYAAWSVVGVNRLMRAELRMRNAPWLWLGFVAFVCVHAAGFVNVGEFGIGDLRIRQGIVDQTTVRFVVAFAVCVATVYLMVLAEAKSAVALRSLGAAIRAGQWARALELAPRWALVVPAFPVLWALIALRTPAGPIADDLDEALLAVLLFAIRDTGIVMYLNMTPRNRRADTAALLYLIVLYGLAPSILIALGLRGLLPFFVPDWSGGIAAAALPPLAEAVIVWVLAGRRWQAGFARAL